MNLAAYETPKCYEKKGNPIVTMRGKKKARRRNKEKDIVNVILV